MMVMSAPITNPCVMRGDCKESVSPWFGLAVIVLGVAVFGYFIWKARS